MTVIDADNYPRSEENLNRQCVTATWSMIIIFAQVGDRMGPEFEVAQFPGSASSETLMNMLMKWFELHVS